MRQMTLGEAKKLRLSPNFTLYEFCYHPVADYHDWYNIPDARGIVLLRLLCRQILQPVRDHFGRPVRIVKGFTCPRLGRQLGDAPNSTHLTGLGVDFKIRGISPRSVVKWIAENLEYDIMMFEFDDYSPLCHDDPWIHVSYSVNGNRKLNLTTESDLRRYRLSDNFTLWELVRSATATARKIFNLPDEAGIEKLRQVAVNILQPVRNHFGRPIRVNSGYRSPKLNAAVRGASKTSQHMRCEAVDYEIMGLDNFELAQWVAQNLTYDQLILEFYGNDKSDPNDGWVHTSYTTARKNRMKDLTINNKGTRSGLIKD